LLLPTFLQVYNEKITRLNLEREKKRTGLDFSKQHEHLPVRFKEKIIDIAFVAKA
jgi:hypothetical protein